jgi:hypothetical protein
MLKVGSTGLSSKWAHSEFGENGCGHFLLGSTGLMSIEDRKKSFSRPSSIIEV